MDDNQNTNQTADQNTSDGGGIFGSFMSAGSQTTSTATPQNINMSDNNNLSTPVSFGSDVQNTQKSPFESIVAEGTATAPGGELQAEAPSIAQLPSRSVFADEVNQAPSSTDQKPRDDMKELESLGVTVVDESATPRNTTVFDSNSQFKKTQTPVSSVMTQPTSVPVDTKALEEDFSNTFSGSSLMDTKSSTVDALDQEEQKLKKLHSELKARAEQKKQKVKEGLEKLKKEKELLGKELQEIKEIEEIASKIAENIQNLEQIDTELDDIEKRAREELS